MHFGRFFVAMAVFAAIGVIQELIRRFRPDLTPAPGNPMVGSFEASRILGLLCVPLVLIGVPSWCLTR